MNITKFGHSCLLIEEKGVRILIDPGNYSTQQNSLKNVHVVLITHNHQDHFDIDSLKVVLKNNPGAKVVTNRNVAEVLEKENISFNIIEDGQSFLEQGVLIEGIGVHHALMHSSIPPIPNTGYFIGGRFFYPGDALTNPESAVEILALPVTGPWMKLSEGIDYAISLKPKICFPVHDGILKSSGSAHRIPPQVLEPKGIKFIVLEIDKEYIF